MPTEYRHQLHVEGAPEALARLRVDDEVWQAQPWRSMFGLHVADDIESGSLTFRYDDDYKRSSPLTADVAATYPDLTFSHEFTDEFGEVAVRRRYAAGSCIEDTRLDPEEFDWIEWEYGD